MPARTFKTALRHSEHDLFSCGVGMRDVQGPAGGQFSIWQDGDGQVTVFMALSDGINAQDRLYLNQGSHIHYNWGFTQRGVYKIGLETTVYIDTDGNFTAGRRGYATGSGGHSPAAGDR